MKNTEIFPEILSSNEKLVFISSINVKNSFVGLNNYLEFCLCAITDKGNVEVKTIVPGFPRDVGDNFGSESNSSLVWMSSGRAFYVMDVLTKKKIKQLISINYNEKINTIKLADYTKNLLMVELTRITGISVDDIKISHLLYDFNDDKITYRNEDVDGAYYPFDNEKMLLCEIVGDGTNVNWIFVELPSRTTMENELTKKMTEHQIDFYVDAKSIHVERKKLLGVTAKHRTVTFKSVAWDDLFEDVVVTPLTIEIPKGFRITNIFKFSGDGNWVKTTGEINQGTGRAEPTNILFYSVNDSYPSSLSLPVVGGPSSHKSSDAYVNHTTLGPIHVNLFNNALLSYKMDDVLEILAEKVKKEL